MLSTFLIILLCVAAGEPQAPPADGAMREAMIQRINHAAEDYGEANTKVVPGGMKRMPLSTDPFLDGLITEMSERVPDASAALWTLVYEPRFADDPPAERVAHQWAQMTLSRATNYFFYVQQGFDPRVLDASERLLRPLAEPLMQQTAEPTEPYLIEFRPYLVAAAEVGDWHQAATLAVDRLEAAIAKGSPADRSSAMHAVHWLTLYDPWGKKARPDQHDLSGKGGLAYVAAYRKWLDSDAGQSRAASLLAATRRRQLPVMQAESHKLTHAAAMALLRQERWRDADADALERAVRGPWAIPRDPRDGPSDVRIMGPDLAAVRDAAFVALYRQDRDRAMQAMEAALDANDEVAAALYWGHWDVFEPYLPPELVADFDARIADGQKPTGQRLKWLAIRDAIAPTKTPRVATVSPRIINVRTQADTPGSFELRLWMSSHYRGQRSTWSQARCDEYLENRGY